MHPLTVGQASLDTLHSVSEATRPADHLAQTLEEALATGLSEPPQGDDHAPRYPCAVWYFKRLSDGRTMPFQCHSWNCPACAWRKARFWCELLTFAPIQRHVVITRIADTPAEASARLRSIVKAIRRGEAVEPDPRGRRRPRRFEYFATAEKHTRAGIHVHLLQHGHFVHQPLFSKMLHRYGAGRITWVERLAKPTLLSDLTRYVTRHLITYLHPHQPKTGPRVRYSRHFWGEGSPTLIRSALMAQRGFPAPDPGDWVLIRVAP